MRKVLAATIGLAGLATTAWAQNPPGSADLYSNITAGHISLGGGMSYTKSSLPPTHFGPTRSKEASTLKTFTLSPSAQYFVADRLAIGANLYLSLSTLGSSQTTLFEAGPIVTYFPWATESFAVKVGGSVVRSVYNIYEEDVYFSEPPYEARYGGYSSSLFVGLDFFITPSLWFGPSFTYSFNSGPRFADSEGLSAGMGFDLYL